MRYQFDFSVIVTYWRDFAYGLLQTLELSALSMVIALALAIVMVACRASPIRALRWGTATFIEMMRNTPFLIQIFFIFFGLPQLGLHTSPAVAAVAAMSLNGAAYCTEILRGGVQAIRQGQIDAGLALGLSWLQTYQYVVLRPALKSVYPGLSSQFILIMLMSSVASTISTSELTLVGIQVEALTFRSFEIFFTLTIMYLITSLMFSYIFERIGKIYFSYPDK